MSYSLCNPKDEFNKKEGVLLANQRFDFQDPDFYLEIDIESAIIKIINDSGVLFDGLVLVNEVFVQNPIKMKVIKPIILAAIEGKFNESKY